MHLTATPTRSPGSGWICMHPGNLTMSSATVFAGVAPMMEKDFPEVKSYCRLVSARVAWSNVEPAQLNVVLSNDAQNIRAIENKGLYADPSFSANVYHPLFKRRC